MVKRLTVHSITSVGAVTDGDNPAAKIMLYKRNTGNRFESRIHSDFTQLADFMFGEGHLTRDERIALSSGIGSALDAFRERIEESAPQLYERDPDMVVKAKAVSRAIAKYRLPFKKHPDRVTQNEGTEMDLTKLDVSDDAKAAIEAEFAKLQARIDELAPADPEDIIKDADPKVAAEFAKQQAELADLRKQADETAAELAKERDERRTVEIAKIADRYQDVIGDNDNAVPMLKSMPDETVEWLTGRLEHMAKIAQASPLFKTAGASGDDNDPAGKLHTMAIEKMGQNPELTIEQARSLARTERPDLAAAERGA